MNKKSGIIVGVVVAAVLLAILFRTMMGNHPPVIANLEADPGRVLRGATSQIVCNATDRDGDELIYGWSASGGTMSMSGAGNTVTWTAPRADGSYNITAIVTDGRGGVATKYVIVEVRSNKAPVISSLTADKDWTLPSGSIQITCNASDPNGDELSYEWSASGGSITGAGSEIAWNAPAETGIYYITVVVTDAYGGSDTRTLPLSVATEQPPIIEQLSISKERYGHCYLKPYSEGYYVGKEQMYDIECIIADTSGEVSYDWTCDGGEISGEGSLITWIAPNTSTKVTVMVIVSDIAGNMASKNLVLNVVPCSTCTFGYCGG
ncbi:MAG: hypothetical protein HXY36_03595 [Chloroflexi bacterium]|nr:hypothetical protein [Chloroflexota bacterium]